MHHGQAQERRLLTLFGKTLMIIPNFTFANLTLISSVSSARWALETLHCGCKPSIQLLYPFFESFWGSWKMYLPIYQFGQRKIMENKSSFLTISPFLPGYVVHLAAEQSLMEQSVKVPVLLVTVTWRTKCLSRMTLNLKKQVMTLG